MYLLKQFYSDDKQIYKGHQKDISYNIITDHIFTNCFVDISFKTMIFKIDFPDHFRICFLLVTSTASEENKTTHVTNRIISNDRIKSFKQELYKTICDDTGNNKNPNEDCNILQ